MRKVVVLFVFLIISGVFLSACDQGGSPSDTTGATDTSSETDAADEEGPIEEPAEDAIDFDFRLSYGVYGRNSVDTYKDTLVKDLVEGTAKTEYVMTEAGKERVLSLLFQYGIPEMPENIDIPDMMVTPATIYKLSYTYEGETKTVEWTNASGMREFGYPQQNQDFQAFADSVISIVESSKEYDKLPASKSAYL
jgi:hypothetical protein